MDSRFRDQSTHAKLSKWIRGCIEVPPSINDVQTRLRSFFDGVQSCMQDMPSPFKASDIQEIPPHRLHESMSEPSTGNLHVPSTVCNVSSPIVCKKSASPRTPEVPCSPQGTHHRSNNNREQCIDLTVDLTQDYSIGQGKPASALPASTAEENAEPAPKESIDTAPQSKRPRFSSLECAVCFEDLPQGPQHAMIPCGSLHPY